MSAASLQNPFQSDSRRLILIAPISGIKHTFPLDISEKEIAPYFVDNSGGTMYTEHLNFFLTAFNYVHGYAQNPSISYALTELVFHRNIQQTSLDEWKSCFQADFSNIFGGTTKRVYFTPVYYNDHFALVIIVMSDETTAAHIKYIRIFDSHPSQLSLRADYFAHCILPTVQDIVSALQDVRKTSIPSANVLDADKVIQSTKLLLCRAQQGGIKECAFHVMSFFSAAVRLMSLSGASIEDDGLFQQASNQITTPHVRAIRQYLKNTLHPALVNISTGKLNDVECKVELQQAGELLDMEIIQWKEEDTNIDEEMIKAIIMSANSPSDSMYDKAKHSTQTVEFENHTILGHMQTFIEHLHLTSENGDILSFYGYLFGQPQDSASRDSRKVFMRKCYAPLYQELMGIMKRKCSTTVEVSGAKGIGKTRFLSYVLWCMLRETNPQLRFDRVAIVNASMRVLATAHFEEIPGSHGQRRAVVDKLVRIRCGLTFSFTNTTFPMLFNDDVRQLDVANLLNAESRRIIWAQTITANGHQRLPLSYETRDMPTWDGSELLSCAQQIDRDENKR